MAAPPTTAYKLPHLLALLPRSGRSALVRQADWPANSFYKVTSTKLKFREVEAGEDKKVKAGGKAWGVLFWKGKLVPPRRNAPAPQIRGGLKHLWTEVPASSLSAEEKQAIVDGEKQVEEIKKASEAVLAVRRRANLDKIAAHAKAMADARDARVRAAHAND